MHKHPHHPPPTAMPSTLNAADSLSAEARLLLATAGGPAQDQAIRRLSSGELDWGRMIAMAVAEGALPIFLRRVREAAPESLPEGSATSLRQLERAADFRLSYLGNRLVDVLTLLTGAGIPVLLLKGAGLAHTVYESVTERPMSDLDLLVPEDRALEARALLLSAGWKHRYANDFDDWYTSMHHLPPMVDTRTPSLQVCLELHTDLFPAGRNPFSLPPAALWQSARPVDGMPEGTVVPGLHHLLLHCCLHYAWLHQFSGSGWRTFRDISIICGDTNVDWTVFVSAAETSRGEASAYWALRMAHSLAGAAVPAEVLSRLRPRSPESLLRLLEQHLAHEAITLEQVCPSERVRRALWRLAVTPPGAGLDRSTARVDHRPWHLLRDSDSDQPRSRTDSGKRPGFSPRAWARYIRAVV